MLSADLGKTCSTSADCDLCGVCIDKNPTETNCYYPYPEAEALNNECKFKHNLCEGYECGVGGKCQYEFGYSGPTCCICNVFYNAFIGQHCDIEWK